MDLAKPIAETEAQTLRAKSALLDALAFAALGRIGAAETYQAATVAWKDGVLTEAEMNGIGKALVAIERQR